MKLKLKKNSLKLILALAFVVIFVFGLVLLLRIWEQRHYSSSPYGHGGEHGQYSDEADESDEGENQGDDLLDEEEVEEVYYNNQWYAKKSGLETVLLIGVDKYLKDTGDETYLNTQQCDFLMAIILDHDNKSYTALHINRDTMTNINILGLNGELAGSMNAQIALAHTYGSGGEDSCENTVTAVSNLLSGTEISHYISVTMDAIPIVNDAVGGVKVVVMDDFSNIRSDFVQGEEITLVGEQALAYVRSRGGLEDSSNLHRMERQKQYLTALKQTFDSKVQDNPALILSILMSINDYMVSDCTVNELSDIASYTHVYEFKGIQYIEGEAIVGEKFVEYYYDEDALNDLIIELYYQPKNDEQ